MNDIKVCEKLLDNNESENVLRVVTDNDNFPWFFNESIVEGVNDSFGFSHVLFVDGNINSPFFKYFEPLLFSMEEKFQTKIKYMIRARIRMTMPTSNTQPYENIMHTDYGIDHKTMVYYINDSDGDTVLFNKFLNDDISNIKEEKRISPLKNRAVFFNGLRYHSGATPSKNRRLVLNVNFVEEK